MCLYVDSMTRSSSSDEDAVGWTIAGSPEDTGSALSSEGALEAGDGLFAAGDSMKSYRISKGFPGI